MLAACCDVNGDAAARFAGEFGFRRHYADYVQMLDEERPDAVCLTVPCAYTAKLAVDIMRRGYPLLLEKPPGMSAGETAFMASEAGKCGTPHMVAFNRRHMPVMESLREELTALEPDGGPDHIHYEMTRTGRTDSDFYTTAVHGLDAVPFLAGTDYASVAFQFRELPELGRGVANMTGVGRMESGCTVSFGFYPVSGTDTERVTVHARNRTIHAELPVRESSSHAVRLQSFDSGRLVSERSGRGSGQAWFETMGFYGENALFFDRVRAGAAVLPGSLASCMRVMEAADCLRDRKPSAFWGK